MLEKNKCNNYQWSLTNSLNSYAIYEFIQEIKYLYILQMQRDFPQQHVHYWNIREFILERSLLNVMIMKTPSIPTHILLDIRDSKLERNFMNVGTVSTGAHNLHSIREYKLLWKLYLRIFSQVTGEHQRMYTAEKHECGKAFHEK